jgi:CheY-like chemotaxis protein
MLPMSFDSNNAHSNGRGSGVSVRRIAEGMPERRSPTLTKRRILIIDNHSLQRHGLATLINNEPDLHVCAEAATQQAGLAAIHSSKPDLVMTGLMLHDGDGRLDFVREIRASHESLPVLVLA